ncbi:MAG: EcsC family protein [Firmicutes bacterium]|nr:EcsC family protein [Bacillota bacterium]
MFASLRAEISQFNKREKELYAAHEIKKENPLNKLLESKLPEGLQNTLETVFSKGFEYIFSLGSEYIEKTFSKSRLIANYKVSCAAYFSKPSKNALRAVSAPVRSRRFAGSFVTLAEGVGLGVAGIGLPDIPLFLAVLIRYVSEIAAGFGIDTDSAEERYFLLKLIDTALSYGEEFRAKNMELDMLIKNGIPAMPDVPTQIELTAKTLSRELLYMKFLQGVTFAGVIGGACDIACYKSVTDYALLKYEKRHLHFISRYVKRNFGKSK